MTRSKISIVAFAIILSSPVLFAQSLTQTIRGTVMDKISKSPLPGATIVLLNSEPLTGTTTDPDGNFKLSKVPVGSHSIKVSFIGYKEITLPNIIVNSGKEVVLTIPIEEDITQMEAVVVTPEIEKNKPLNDMASVSARTFSVDETRKFAAAVNDPARMVASYAGVVQTSDGNNSISIRGNSPFGLLWRMEGVDIPNPNHFAGVANSGGGISILSSQLLTNSDFLTGAFPAEYGNALAGVFDLNLRKGNNEKREYTVQAGLLGMDVAAEGPFSKKFKGSYLINYRYSTLSILSKLGLEIFDGATDFQDLSYNFYLPTRKAGNFSLFGFGGLSSQKYLAKKDSSKWENNFDRFNSEYFSNTGAMGMKHAITLNPNTYLQSSFVVSGNDLGYEQDKLDDSYVPRFDYKQNYINKKVTASSVLNHKFNARHSIRSGVYFNEYFYNLRQRDLNPLTNQVDENLNARGDATTTQLFTQWNFRVTEKLTMNSGVHVLHLFDNNSSSVEPRASVKYELTEKKSVSLGYGLHSQMQPVGIYEAQQENADGSVNQPNKDLGFNKAHHVGLAYDQSLTKYLRIKAETYYQQLYNIAVFADPTRPLAVTNNEEGYITDPLVNKGTGRNYGLELTLEQFTHNDLYFLLSSSLYDSRYKALDGVLRNSRYNGNFAFSFTAGKEFHQTGSKNRTFGINLRTIYSGGFRTTPIDFNQSILEGETKYIESQAYAQQLPDYFRTDLRFSIKRNRAKTTSTLALDIQNASNRKNVYGSFFDLQSGKVKTEYQLPLLPILSYRVEF
jgi:CarboxypepD_reg-like domain/TonB-dependent Receptor Plug Domain